VWFFGGFLVDVHGILRAVLTPMPIIRFASPNVLNQSDNLAYGYLLMTFWGEASGGFLWSEETNGQLLF
jgi:hypothetical protein